MLFPVPGKPAHQHDSRPGPAQVAQRQRVQRAGAAVGAVHALLPLQAGHLGPHVGPLGDVVVQERPGQAFARERLVVEHEPLGGIGPSESLEVHGEEGDVGAHVAVAEAVGELDAVEDADAVVEAEHVLRLEVAVAVADPSLGDAVVEQRAVPPEPALDQRADLPVHGGVEDAADEAFGLCRNCPPTVPARAAGVAASEIAGERSAPAWNAASWAATSRSHPSTSPPARTSVASRRSSGSARITTMWSIGSPSMTMSATPR